MSPDVIPPVPPPPIPSGFDMSAIERLAAISHQSDDSQDYLGAIIVVATLLICVALPLCLWFWSRMRSVRRLSSADQKGVQELWSTAERMETRIGYLERVLDTEVPGWRSRSEMR